MKKVLLLSLVIICTGNLSAQTWNEWFRQKKTQKKYLLQQIAALQVYGNLLSQGYTVARNGLGIIQDIKQGDFDLHSKYFTSLVIVNPKIKSYTKVGDIITLQVSISRRTATSIKNFSNSHQFTNKELDYFKEVFKTLLNDCFKNLDELYNLITNGSLKMKDDERIEAIDKIYNEMQDKKMFIISFCNNAIGLSVQRSNEVNDIMISKRLNGLR